MSFPKITAVISFCSNDWRFLKYCIAGVAPLCEEILITVCDHFFDGTEENYALLEEAFRRFPSCRFLEFSFDPQESYRFFSSVYPGHPNWRHEWHNTGRLISYFYAAPYSQYLLFLDCDEIVDSQAFSLWLLQADLEKYAAMRFASYYYFREAKFEALAQDDFGLLADKKALHLEFLWDEDERMGIFHNVIGEKKLGVRGLNGEPMIRHYSGVRTKLELLKKFATWGHHWERNWTELVLEEFSRPFNGRDFLRKYRYREVEPILDPLQEQIPLLSSVSLEQHLKGLHRFPNVTMVSREEIFRRQLSNEFDLSLSSDH